MRRERVRDLLAMVADGSLAVDRALDSLALEPAESLGFATIDHHRALRQGFPEVVYGGGKTPEQVVAIARRIADRGDGVLVTRVAAEAVALLLDQLPGVEYNPLGRTAFLRPPTAPEVAKGSVLIVTGSPTSASPAFTACSRGGRCSSRPA